MTQAQVAERAGVHHTMVSAYERGQRRPTFTTVERLLAAAGAELTIGVQAIGSDLDSRIERALAMTAEERCAGLDGILEMIRWPCTELPTAFGGRVAAALHGAPVELGEPELFVAETEGVPEELQRRMIERGFSVWDDERERFVRSPYDPAVMRTHNPSGWQTPLAEAFTISLCPAEKISAAIPVAYGTTELPVLNLWDVELADPELGRLLARTREILAERARAA